MYYPKDIYEEDDDLEYEEDPYEKADRIYDAIKNGDYDYEW